MAIHHLPLNALRAFDAAAEKGSFKLAAEHLGVTPTAISHQIKRLEELIQVQLFVRYVRRIELTKDGRSLYRVTSNAFNELSIELERLQNDPQQTVVSIAVSPIVASRWLTPRLTSFWDRYPEIDLRLHHSAMAIDPGNYDTDLAVVWGEPPWKGFEAEKFIVCTIIPVVSKQTARRLGRNPKPDSLLKETLIHQRNYQGWRHWFEAAGLEPDLANKGRVIEDSTVTLHGAMRGHGIALGIVEFLDDDLATGRLVCPFKVKSVLPQAYYLIHRRGRRPRRKCRWSGIGYLHRSARILHKSA